MGREFGLTSEPDWAGPEEVPFCEFPVCVGKPRCEIPEHCGLCYGLPGRVSNTLQDMKEEQESNDLLD